MKSAAPSDAGFTLVEALVSLFIFALVAGGGVLLLSQTLLAQADVEEAQDGLRELQSARALLAADLAQITPRATRDPNRPPFAFHAVGGARPEMSFVRAQGEPGSEGQISTSLVVVSYALDEAGRLVRSTRAAIDPGPNAVTRDRAIIASAGDVAFAFHDGLGWRADWPPSMSVIPQAVAIEVTLPRYGRLRLQALTGL